MARSNNSAQSVATVDNQVNEETTMNTEVIYSVNQDHPENLSISESTESTESTEQIKPETTEDEEIDWTKVERVKSQALNEFYNAELEVWVRWEGSKIVLMPKSGNRKTHIGDMTVKGFLRNEGFNPSIMDRLPDQINRKWSQSHQAENQKRKEQSLQEKRKAVANLFA